MPEEAVLQEELGPTFEAYREAAQREINFSTPELTYRKNRLLERLWLIRAELICRGFKMINKKECAGDFRLAEIIRQKREGEIILQAAKILFDLSLRVLEKEVSEMDVAEIRRYFVRQMDKYIDFLDSINTLKQSKEIA